MRHGRPPCLVFPAIALAAAMSVFPCAICAAQTSQDWDDTEAQKMWGLMQVWGAVKYNFAFFDHVPDLDWDAAVRASIPRVLAAEDREEYYRRLNELTALLHDGHTLVLSPSLMNGEFDNPPVECQVEIVESSRLCRQRSAPVLFQETASSIAR